MIEDRIKPSEVEKPKNLSIPAPIIGKTEKLVNTVILEESHDEESIIIPETK